MKPVFSRFILLGTCLWLFAISTPFARQSNSPDASGYTFIDSHEINGPWFSYEDISQTENKQTLLLADDAIQTVEIGFEFTFYGEKYSKITIASNGNLSFSNNPNESYNRNGFSIPQNESADNWQALPFLAPLYDDLNPKSTHPIHIATLGNKPNRKFIVQYQVPAYGNDAEEFFDFEIVLFEFSSNILFQYQSMETTNPSNNLGASATVGIQGNNLSGLNYSNNESVIGNGLAILFSQVKDPYISITPSSIEAAPGSIVTHSLSLTNQTGEDAIFDIAISNSQWITHAPDDTGWVKNGETINVDITVEIPPKDMLNSLSDKPVIHFSNNQISANLGIETRTSILEEFITTESLQEFDSSADGRYVVFSSSEDITGENTNNYVQIFVTDNLYQKSRQLSSFNENNNIFHLNISDDGEKIFFISNENLTGSNSDKSWEIFYIQRSNKILSQLLDNPFGTLSPKPLNLSNNANKILFTSNADLVAGENAEKNTQIFLWDATLGVQQITYQHNNNDFACSISADGDSIVFHSNSDLTGKNADFSHEIFIWHSNTGIQQLTYGQSEYLSPVISADGMHVVFFANYIDQEAGTMIVDLHYQNVNENKSVVLAQNLTAQATSTLVIPSSVFSYAGQNGSLAINEDGSKIIFKSALNQVSKQPLAKDNLYLIGNEGLGITQLTDTEAGNLFLTSDGDKLLFANTDTNGVSKIFQLHINEHRGLLSSPKIMLNGNLTTREDGSSTSMEIVLQGSAPDSDVYIDFSTDDPGEGDLQTKQLLFTRKNWNIPQTVIINGVDDLQQDGDTAFTVNYFISSSDVAYNNKTGTVSGFKNLDDDINTAPQGESVNITVDTDQSFAYQLTASDVNKDVLSFILKKQPEKGDLAFDESGTFIYLADEGMAGPDSFSYSVFDGLDESAIMTVNIFIQAKPVAIDSGFEVGIKDVITGRLYAVDQNNDILTYFLVDTPQTGEVQLAPDGSFIYKIDSESQTSDSFIFRVSDGIYESNNATVSISIRAAPDVGEIKLSVNPNREIHTALPDVDQNGNKLTFAMLDNGTKGIAEINEDGSFSYKANEGESGNDVVIVKVSNGKSESIASIDIDIELEKTENQETNSELTDEELQKAAALHPCLVLITLVFLSRLKRRKRSLIAAE